MKKEYEDTLENLVVEFENLIRKTDRLILRYEKQKAKKLAETTKLLNSHDPLMNAEQPPMVLFASLFAALSRVHNLEQLHKLRFELDRIHGTTLLSLDALANTGQKIFGVGC